MARYFVNDEWNEMIVEQETQSIVISESGGNVEYKSFDSPIVFNGEFKEIDELTAVEWKDTVLLRLKRNMRRIDEAFLE